VTRRAEEIALKEPHRFMSDVPQAGSVAPSFLAGGGELGALIRAYDWSRTALGAPDTWPQGLKIAIRIMLTSRQPIWIGWGDELLYFYNDPYKAIIGGKHPVALGQPTRVVWREIWPDIEPLLNTALTGAEGIFVEQKLLIMERNGFPEETYYTFSYSPIPGDDGEPGGIICANSDDTMRVVGERQLALLKELAAASPDGRDWREACELSARALRTNAQDLPFALLYAAEPGGDTVTLVGASGIEPGHPGAPESMRIDDDARWPLADVLKLQVPHMVRGLTQRFGTQLPAGPWHIAPEQAVILPVSPGSETTHAVALVAGLNPCRLYDNAYRSFLNLAAGQIGAAIGYAQAYQEERRRAEALAEIDRAKTTFFSNISHEFRTPLTLMLGPLEELLAKPQLAVSADSRKPGADVDDRALIEITHRNGLRLLKLVNALLDFSRIEAGRMQIATQPTDIASFTAELASLFQSAIEAAGLRLEVEIPSSPVIVQLDREMWEKVVMNLLSNAYKFTFFGTIGVAVRALEGGGVEVSVTDSGIGVAQEEVPRLFERFHRVAGAPGRSVEGSGIGLAMVQELVKLHGGTVRVDSKLGEGACFTVALPRGAMLPSTSDDAVHASMSRHARSYVDAALRWSPENEILVETPVSVSASASSNVPGEPASGVSSAPAARLLVVDDNADLREYMSRILRAAGHDVRLAADGEAALEAARAEPPDLVLSDVMMPRLDGFGLLRELRADPLLCDTPVLMLSTASNTARTTI
jgi:signal transduction histidine kinase